MCLPFLASLGGRCDDGTLGNALTPDRWEALVEVGVQSLIAVGVGLDLEPVKREIDLREPPEITSRMENSKRKYVVCCSFLASTSAWTER
jgi:hypothetical protein